MEVENRTDPGRQLYAGESTELMRSWSLTSDMLAVASIDLQTLVPHANSDCLLLFPLPAVPVQKTSITPSKTKPDITSVAEPKDKLATQKAARNASIL